MKNHKTKFPPKADSSQARKILIILPIIFLAIFQFGESANANVIFAENFDNIADGWNCTNTTPPGWTSKSGCEGPNTYDGQTHYGYEISSGGRSGNSLKIWTHVTFPNDRTFNVLNYTFAVTTYRELYTRWYMKIPSDITISGPITDYLKFWRYDHGTNTTYFNWNYWTSGVPGSGGFYIAPSAYGPWITVLSPTDVPYDNAWHCHELRIKLNSTGKSDGIIQYWLDGVLKVNKTDVNFNAVDADYFKNAGIGIGNRREGTTFQTLWRAIEFDDYVVSTTYIGPDQQPDTTPPSAPTGVSVS